MIEPALWAVMHSDGQFIRRAKGGVAAFDSQTRAQAYLNRYGFKDGGYPRGWHVEYFGQGPRRPMIIHSDKNCPPNQTYMLDT